MAIEFQFPTKSKDEIDVLRVLRFASDDNLDRYQKELILGFPGTYPHELALKTFAIFSELNPNNIGTHTHLDKSVKPERGGERKAFYGVNQLERQVIYMLGDLLGVKNPVEKNIDGYITSGGTEANLMGLWVGRNKLCGDVRDVVEYSEICVIAALSAHYSIHKACGSLPILY
ncbi:MAG: hypothetical protein Fur0017_31490 [Anaerolineales bacterium]